MANKPHGQVGMKDAQVTTKKGRKSEEKDVVTGKRERERKWVNRKRKESSKTPIATG